MMTKLTSKIATALAILGLAGPALAANAETTKQPAAATAQAQQPKRHKKVAQSDGKKATEKKATKKAQKKHKSHASETKANETAPAPAAPAPAK